MIQSFSHRDGLMGSQIHRSPASLVRLQLLAYVSLLGMSIVGFGQRQGQILVTSLWLFGVAVWVFRIQQRGRYKGSWGRASSGYFRNRVGWRRRMSAPLIGAFVCSQAPGMTFAGISLWHAVHGSMNEWANGLLEIWVSPFLPFLERLPAHSVHQLSETYIAACITPFAIVILLTTWTLLSRRLT